MKLFVHFFGNTRIVAKKDTISRNAFLLSSERHFLNFHFPVPSEQGRISCWARSLKNIPNPPGRLTFSFAIPKKETFWQWGLLATTVTVEVHKKMIAQEDITIAPVKCLPMLENADFERR